MNDKKIITEGYDIEQACKCIIYLWQQYGDSRTDEENHLLLNHSCMSSGEMATDFLGHYGYGVDVGYSVALTRKGLILADEGDYSYKGIDE